MQKFLVVAGGVALAFVLEGCGTSSGSSKSGPCASSQFQVVSQSYSATTTGTIDIKFSNKSLPPMPPTPSLDSKNKMKIDVDEMNLYEETSQSNPNMSIYTRVIFNAAKKQIVVKYNVSVASPMGEGFASENCTAVTIPTLPEPSVLAQCFKEATAAFGKFAKCTSDGTYDTWEMSVKLPDPSMPVPLPNGTTLDTQYKVLFNKDHLFHAATETANEQLDVPNVGTMTEKMDMSMTVDGGVATAGGPSAADLDYSSWGRCYDIPFHPPHFQSFVPFLQAGEELSPALQYSVSGRSHSSRLALKAISSCIPNLPPSTTFVV